MESVVSTEKISVIRIGNKLFESAIQMRGKVLACGIELSE
jgi:hypothetical protein